MQNVSEMFIHSYLNSKLKFEMLTVIFSDMLEKRFVRINPMLNIEKKNQNRKFGHSVTFIEGKINFHLIKT